VRKLARYGVASKISITCTIIGLFEETMAYKAVIQACSATLNCFLYVYGAVVDNFVIVSFFLE